ncbi:MAG: L,D-transpeptidase [Armatimonadetes bacterium]|nr:L,D-transpeptidase [Armatimonadota bacterium]
MRWLALLFLTLLFCSVAVGPGVSASAAANDGDGVPLPLVREPMPEPPNLFPPTGPPLKPLPKRTGPAKPVAPIVVKPVPVPPEPPPEPRFDPNAPPALTLAYPTPETVVAEGAQKLVWHTSGPVVQVKVTYSGDRCRLGGRSRGTFGGTVGKFANKGTAQWNVPWMDATEFRLRLTGYDAEGQELTSDERRYPFHPRLLEGKPDTCIVVSKPRQRLYYLSDGAIRRMHIISTAMGGYTTPTMKPGSYGRRGAMGRVFSKQYAPVSSLYHVVMYYWLGITSSGSHGIHATTPRFYGRLGGPASHGCIRQHRADAKILWGMVSVGTPVYVQ